MYFHPLIFLDFVIVESIHGSEQGGKKIEMVCGTTVFAKIVIWCYAG